MKTKSLLLVVLLSLLPAGGFGATATARMWCWSLQFQQGSGPFDLYSLDLTTLGSGVNGELAPLFSTYSHGCWFYLNDEIFDESIPGTIYLNTPAFSDANGDGFDDFFDVTQGVGASSSGIYAYDFEGVWRTVSASWSRAADSTYGTCVLNLQDAGAFTHTFQLLEYTGPLTYTPGSNSVSGSIALTNTANPLETFLGPVVFTKSTVNSLTLQAGNWTDANTTVLPFNAHGFSRSPAWPTNYYGFFEFDDDANPASFQPYASWYLSIDDLNDADHDGIPDFSDDPLVGVRRPTLALTRGTTNLWLSIRGDVGHLHRVQEVNSLASTNWQTILSVTLTNDPQTISLPLPATGQKFWRVSAQ